MPTFDPKMLLFKEDRRNDKGAEVTKTSHVVAGALIFYLFLAVGGGVTYYIVSTKGQAARPAPKIASQTQDSAAKSASPKEEEALPNEEASVGETATEKTTDTDDAEERLRGLAADMEVVLRNGLTFYHYEQEERPPTGVYLRPFVIESSWGPIMKNDVYYFASLAGGYFDWIHGDSIAVSTGGAEYELYFNSGDRRDRLGQDAETLFENFVVDADEEALEMFRAIGSSGYAAITYYNRSDGKSYSRELSSEEVRRIANMIELYDILEELYRK